MQRLIATNSVPLSGADTQPTSGTPQYATDGNPGVTSPTIWPAYAWNMTQDELMNALLAAGITPDGTNWAQLAQAIAIIGKRQVIFATAGTWTAPTGVTRARYRIWGGGAGGTGSSSGTAGGGGPGGGYTEGAATVVPGTGYAVTVGGGGPAGSNGGTSSFAGFAQATGGQVSGTAGTGSGGTLNLTGNSPGLGTVVGGIPFGGWGGGTFSTGNTGQSIGSGAGQQPNYPGGRGGGGANGGAGSAGANGLIILEY